MADLFSGLSSMGLGNLEDMELFEKPKEVTPGAPTAPKEIEEKDLLLDRTYACPVCDSQFKAKTLKTGKAKALRTDLDLRTVLEGIDSNKYDVLVCPTCGYATITRLYTKSVMDMAAKKIKEKISMNFRWEEEKGETYSYEEAFKRYQIALVNYMVRPDGKNSMKAFICLKTAWLMRGWKESLEDKPDQAETKKQVEAQEKAYIMKAYEGFKAAVSTENFPMVGMDESTIDYLLAALAYEIGDYEYSSRLVSKLLTTSKNDRVKNKARDLKDLNLEALKKRQH